MSHVRRGLGGMFELGAMLASRQQGKHAGRMTMSLTHADPR